jgi:hypothetical protein
VLNASYFFSYFLKIEAPSSSIVMFTGQMTATLFAIVIVSSLIVVSGSFVGSAYAHTTTKNKVKQHQYLLSLPISPALDKDKPVSRTAHNANPDNSTWSFGDVKSVPTKEMYYWRKICNT